MTDNINNDKNDNRADIKHHKLPTEVEQTDKDNSFDNAQFKMKKITLSNQVIKPKLINSSMNLSKENEKKSNDKHHDDFLNINDIVITNENIQKELGNDTLINSQQSKAYITLTRLLFSKRCIYFYIFLITISMLILLYSVIGYFMGVSIVSY